MSRLCCLLVFVSFVGCANVSETEPPVQRAESDAKAPASAGGTFQVKFETTKGDFVVEVHEDWSPNGARHLRKLVESGFYTDIAIFRVVDNFMAQFGISGDPDVTGKWDELLRDNPLMDDPVKKSNLRGYLTYAKTGAPNSRSSQLFINYKDNSFLDPDGFSPVGIVLGDGMAVVDAFESKYGDPPGSTQMYLRSQGNSYAKKAMPDLDYIKSATIIAENGEPVAGAEQGDADAGSPGAP